MFGELAADLVHELSDVGVLSPEQVAAVKSALLRHPEISAGELGTEFVKRGLECNTDYQTQNDSII